MFLSRSRDELERHAFLCLRRGVSQYTGKNEDFTAFSLPTQRCFSLWGTMRPHAMLFSAYAEVFPRCTGRTTPLVTFLCLRRGVSPLPAVQEVQRLFSLPTQRCFPLATSRLWSSSLFSAYAEVFPEQVLQETADEPFLCLRRGVSIFNCLISKHRNFSLPTQRCFSGIRSADHPTRLFSAYAEVFLCLKAL